MMARHFTPLRYPGGKAKLAGFVKEIFKSNDLCDGHYAEPYAGGAGVAIELLLTGYSSHIHLNDLNYPVYSFWHSILNHPEEFCRKISRVKLSITTWQRQRAIASNFLNHDPLEVGFAFFFLNRTNRSGIISGGVIGGLDQTGPWKIDARFGRPGLIDRIENIANHSSQISIYNLDAIKFLEKVEPKLPEKSLIYLDPPYFIQGKRLYDNFYNPEDHGLIASKVGKLKRQWMVSYDDVPEVRDLYQKYRQTTHDLNYSAGIAYKGTEVLIFSKKLKVPSDVMVETLEKSA